MESGQKGNLSLSETFSSFEVLEPRGRICEKEDQPAIRKIRSPAVPLQAGVNVFLFNVGSVSEKKSGYDALKIYRGNRRRSRVELGYNVMKGTECFVSF
jgi:hypothetical protein